MRNICQHCHGYGYVQVYVSRVRRVFCDCEAGDKRLQESKDSLREIGLNPDEWYYDWSWTRRSDLLDKK